MRIKADSLSKIYQILHNEFDAENYFLISPRGQLTKEIIAPDIILENPRNRLIYHPERNFNYKFAFVESLMLFSHSSAVKYPAFANPRIKDFSDDGVSLHGSYGARIASYIPSVIEKLKSDSNSRQAVLSIYDNSDLVFQTKDVPCTLTLQFLVRDNKLHMITNMRSNDIWWGLPYDVFIFTTLQELIANELGVELGQYHHRPASLHLYERHFKIFEDIAYNFENINICYKASRNKIGIDFWRLIATNYMMLVDGKCSGELFEKYYRLIERAWSE